MNIIDERDKRTIFRKAKKRQYDELMTLSTQEENWVRLLDEGMVTYGDGSPWFYLAKGTLRNFYNNLSPEYIGSINVGHTDLATWPDRVVGQWTKNDLRLIDIGDGREALDVRLNLWEAHPTVKALRMAPFDLGVSAEFYTHVNEELTNNKELNPFGVEIVDGVNITDFAIVGDAGNVNSMGIRLKGGTMDFKSIELALQNEGGNAFEKAAEALETLTHEMDPEEPEVETPEEAPEEEPEEAPEETPEEPEEVVEETTEEVSEEDAAEEDITSLAAAIENLQAENQSLKEQIESLKKSLSSKNADIKKLAGFFKTARIEPTDAPQPVKTNVQYTDGIGD